MSKKKCLFFILELIFLKKISSTGPQLVLCAPLFPSPFIWHLIQSFSVIFFLFTFKLTKISFLLIKHLVGPITFSGSIFSFLLLPDTCCLYCLSAHFLYNSLKISFSLCFSSGLLVFMKVIPSGKRWFLLNCTATVVFHYAWKPISLNSQDNTVLYVACRSSYIDVLVDSWADVFSLSYCVAYH